MGKVPAASRGARRSEAGQPLQDQAIEAVGVDRADDPAILRQAGDAPPVDDRHAYGRLRSRLDAHVAVAPVEKLRPQKQRDDARVVQRTKSEEQTSELQSLMRLYYAVFCLKKKTTNPQ